MHLLRVGAIVASVSTWYNAGVPQKSYVNPFAFVSLQLHREVDPGVREKGG
jgi:hypothetical protein